MEKSFNYIVVRIRDNVRVIFEDEFIDKNPFKTQNVIVQVLKLLYQEHEFNVSLSTYIPKN